MGKRFLTNRYTYAAVLHGRHKAIDEELVGKGAGERLSTEKCLHTNSRNRPDSESDGSDFKHNETGRRQKRNVLVNHKIKS
jgi:hypothetical protein